MGRAAPVVEQRLDALAVMREAGIDGIARRGGLDFGLVLDSVSPESAATARSHSTKTDPESGGREKAGAGDTGRVTWSVAWRGNACGKDGLCSRVCPPRVTRFPDVT